MIVTQPSANTTHAANSYSRCIAISQEANPAEPKLMKYLKISNHAHKPNAVVVMKNPSRSRDEENQLTANSRRSD